LFVSYEWERRFWTGSSFALFATMMLHADEKKSQLDFGQLLLPPHQLDSYEWERRRFLFYYDWDRTSLFVSCEW
jgi:hypothetical protein